MFSDTMVSSGAGILLCLRNLRLQARERAVAWPPAVQLPAPTNQLLPATSALLLTDKDKISAKKSRIVSAPVQKLVCLFEIVANWCQWPSRPGASVGATPILSLE